MKTDIIEPGNVSTQGNTGFWRPARDGTGVTDPAATIKHLSQAIRYRTISPDSLDAWQPEPFENFRDYLQKSWPEVHDALEHQLIGNHSLLYIWPGHDPALDPALFMAHYDVVPVETGSETDWTHPPFAGDVADGG